MQNAAPAKFDICRRITPEDVTTLYSGRTARLRLRLTAPRIPVTARVVSKATPTVGSYVQIQIEIQYTVSFTVTTVNDC